MAGIRAIGAKLSYTDTGEKFIAHLTSLGALTLNNEEIDVTDHDSENGKREFIPGQTGYDDLSFQGNVVDGDDTFSRLWSLANNRTVKEFTAEYADGSTLEFEGYIASAAMGEQTTDGLIGFEGSIKISGDVVFTAAPTPSA